MKKSDPGQVVGGRATALPLSLVAVICFILCAHPVLGYPAIIVLTPLAVLPLLARISFLPGTVSLALLVIWCFASATWTFVHRGPDAMSFDLSMSLLVVLAVGVVPRGKGAVQILIAAAAAGMAVMLSRFFAMNGITLSFDTESGSGRHTVPGINANYLSYLIVTVCALTLALVNRGRRMHWLAWFGWFGISLVATTMTGSRGALISLALIGVWVVLHPLVARWANLVGRVAWLALPTLAVSGVLDEALRPAKATIRETGDLNGRLTIWPLARELFHEHPLRGTGAGTFEFISGLGIRTHNAFLSYASETGIVGLVLFLTATWRLGVTPLRDGSERLMVGVAVLLAAAPILYTGAWDRSPVFWLSLALSGAYSRAWRV